MARPRRKSGAQKRATTKKASAGRKRSTAATTTSVAETGQFVCPECGKSFARAASLGAHRNRAHGVSGAARQNSAREDGDGSRGRGAAQSRSVDRDALLAALFPNGIPAKERVIRDLNGWLDQAEKLSRLS